MSAYLHRYRLDTSEPTKAAVARDVAIRGVLPALGLLACVWAVGTFLFPPSGFGDEAVLSRSLQAGRTPLLDLLALTVSHIAGVVGAPLTALVGVFWLWRATRRWWFALVPLLSVTLEALVYQTAALLVTRERPAGAEQLDFGLPDASYPSGHVGAAACLATVLVLVLAASDRPRWVALLAGALGAGWTLAVAVSRFYLGMHHPSDAIAGAVIGVTCAFLGWGVLRRNTSAGA